jgi:hypothetical protein
MLCCAVLCHAVHQHHALQAFAKGVRPFLEAVQEHDFLHATKLTLMLAAIAVPLNTVFVTVAAILITRNEFPGKVGDISRGYASAVQSIRAASGSATAIGVDNFNVGPTLGYTSSCAAWTVHGRQHCQAKTGSTAATNMLPPLCFASMAIHMPKWLDKELEQFSCCIQRYFCTKCISWSTWPHCSLVLS